MTMTQKDDTNCLDPIDCELKQVESKLVYLKESLRDKQSRENKPATKMVNEAANIDATKCPCGNKEVAWMKCAVCRQPAKGCTECYRRVSSCACDAKPKESSIPMQEESDTSNISSMISIEPSPQKPVEYTIEEHQDTPAANLASMKAIINPSCFSKPHCSHLVELDSMNDFVEPSSPQARADIHDMMMSIVSDVDHSQNTQINDKDVDEMKEQLNSVMSNIAFLTIDPPELNRAVVACPSKQYVNTNAVFQGVDPQFQKMQEEMENYVNSTCCRNNNTPAPDLPEKMGSFSACDALSEPVQQESATSNDPNDQHALYPSKKLDDLLTNQIRLTQQIDAMQELFNALLTLDEEAVSNTKERTEEIQPRNNGEDKRPQTAREIFDNTSDSLPKVIKPTSGFTSLTSLSPDQESTPCHECASRRQRRPECVECEEVREEDRYEPSGGNHAVPILQNTHEPCGPCKSGQPINLEDIGLRIRHREHRGIMKRLKHLVQGVGAKDVVVNHQICQCGSNKVALLKCEQCHQPVHGCSRCLRRLGPCVCDERERPSGLSYQRENRDERHFPSENRVDSQEVRNRARSVSIASMESADFDQPAKPCSECHRRNENAYSPAIRPVERQYQGHPRQRVSDSRSIQGKYRNRVNAILDRACAECNNRVPSDEKRRMIRRELRRISGKIRGRVNRRRGHIGSADRSLEMFEFP